MKILYTFVSCFHPQNRKNCQKWLDSNKVKAERSDDLTRAGLKPMQLHWAPRLWGPAPWCVGRLFIFARYTLRLRNQ